MASITLQPAGTRIYIDGNTYPIKDQLRRAGCHWDGERKAWWIGAAKRADIEHLVSSDTVQQQSAAEPQRDATPDASASVRARASYKGRDYYVLAETRDRSKLLLAARNGQFQFWAAAEATQITKTYGRENYRSGRTEYPTLGGMIRRAEEWRAARQQGDTMPQGHRYECEECGEMVTHGDGSSCWETGCAH
ncbi:MAG: hypothetical protein A3H96_11245 [Acidobacteria bacterium RIFCSPLOWO2_02_FULL_67_36]|nr:MAG: hypothetical protein A3H96_11245 [Acidobacteria bacterium RIFCSPLOWO2_02_FULL_67_36]OFW23973.1 MAG: hypothetical protein A3G21_03615 [Acidobacteria bacterium RIFCSPLOWO2_12_FULL_66_21]